MKVLQIASSLGDWGGIERYVLYLGQGLRARGHDVTIVCPPGSPLDTRWDGSKERHRLRRASAASLAFYLRVFRDRPFDVVHVHFSPDFTLPAIAARVRKQNGRLMTRHLALRWSSRKAQRYLAMWPHIVPVSHAVQRALFDSGIPESAMTVAYAGTPPLHGGDRQATRARLGAQGFLVGTFGRLVPEKGVDVFLRALRGLDGVQGFVFGDGPLLDSLRAEAPWVRFEGRVTDVGPTMGAMDAVVIPSTWAEAFPYAALEAMSLGRPILASRVGGIPEAVEDGVTGRLVEAGHPGALANVLREWAADPSVPESLGAAGQTRFTAEFTVEAMAERFERVYTAVAAR